MDTIKSIRPEEVPVDPEQEPLRDKVLDTFGTLQEELGKPVEGGVEPPTPRRFVMGETMLDFEVSDALFSGVTDGEGQVHKTYLDGIDISPVLQGIEFKAGVNEVNKITLHMTGLPTRIRALGVVEIKSKGLDEVADNFMARAEADERVRIAVDEQREAAVSDETDMENPQRFPPNA